SDQTAEEEMENLISTFLYPLESLRYILLSPTIPPSLDLQRIDSYFAELRRQNMDDPFTPDNIEDWHRLYRVFLQMKQTQDLDLLNNYVWEIEARNNQSHQRVARTWYWQKFKQIKKKKG